MNVDIECPIEDKSLLVEEKLIKGACVKLVRVSV